MFREKVRFLIFYPYCTHNLTEQSLFPCNCLLSLNVSKVDNGLHQVLQAGTHEKVIEQTK